MLGVKPQTLYAYVSRGLLTSQSGRGPTGSLYLRRDIEALRAKSRARSGHGPAAAGAMRWGEPVLESQICCIQDGMVHYRGYAVSRLIERRVSFENVAELLWSGDLPTKPTYWQGAPHRGRFGAEGLGRGLSAWLASHASLDGESGEERLDQTLTRARRVILGTAHYLLGATSDGDSLAAAASRGILGKDVPEGVDALAAALIASADHELNASTFAARIAASTGADFYACVQAALAAFSGRRHGLSPIDAVSMIQGWTTEKQARQTVKTAAATQTNLPGFGHPLYPDGDPRAAPLIARARALAQRRGGAAARLQAHIDALLEEVSATSGAKPNLDFGLAAVTLALGLEATLAAGLFALGRLAGWTAHVVEQRQQDFLLRPRARYTGRAPVKDEDTSWR